MSANNDDIFDEDFDEFEDGGQGSPPARSAGGNGGSSLLDLWNNNPMVKLALIAGLVVIAIGSVYAFVGGKEKEGPPSRVGGAPGDTEVPGGEVSETYGDALDEQNQQKLEQALGNRNVSAIPVPVNRNENALTLDGTQDTSAEDPLAIWQRENKPETVEETSEVVPEPIVAPAPPAPVQVPQEQIQGISEAINNQIQSILASRTVKPGRSIVASIDRTRYGTGGQEANNDPTPETGPKTGFGNEDVGSSTEEILVPAGSILYGQVLNEANSDTPGPIVAQILSGPLSGSRVIGDFQMEKEKIIISFEKVVVNGVSNDMDGVAIDPSTTSPGLATDVDKRYFRRIILPAAARFVEGLGDAYADSETQVFTSGDVIVTQEDKLKTKQQFAKGVAEGADRAAEILEDEGDKLEPLVRVEAGTPIGIILVEPILKPPPADVAYPTQG